MAYLSREQILAADDIPTGEVAVPEWADGDADTVRIRALSGIARDRLEQAIMAGGKKPNLEYLRARAVAASIIHEDGALMFTEADVRRLGAKSAAALNRVFEAVSKLSAVTAADVEELAGNSGAGQSDDSASDSPATSDAPSPSS